MKKNKMELGSLSYNDWKPSGV